jgi:peroxiredoxin
MLQVGDRAPDFKAAFQDGSPFQLSEWLKDSHVVLYFFPKAFTAG